MSRRLFALACLASIACASSSQPPQHADAMSRPDAREDARPEDGGVDEDASIDSGADAGTPEVGGEDASIDGGAAFDPGPEPTEPIRPIAGEVTIIQLDLLPGAMSNPGEAAIIVGPDGTTVIVDSGNLGHDSEVREAIRALNTIDLIPARGFAARAPLQVEWVLLTHFHRDHSGGAPALLGGAEPIQVMRGVVHRGFVDLGAGLTAGDMMPLCNLLQGSLASVDAPLCVAASPAPCMLMAGANYPAVGCPGLLDGDLTVSGDSGASFIPLGGGAQLRLHAASGFASDGATAVQMPMFGYDQNNQENARSVAALLSHGAFRFHLAGDLGGQGTPDTPDAESHLVSIAGDVLFGALGADVTHANHHGRTTASNATFVGALAPRDGRARNVIIGINAGSGYRNLPMAATLDAWTGNGRLAGGFFWTPEVPQGGATGAALIDAGGPLIIQTIQGGRGYRIQAAGAPLVSHAYRSVRD